MLRRAPVFMALRRGDGGGGEVSGAYLIVHEIVPGYSPVKSGDRFSVNAVMASTKSFDWMNAAFHRAT